MDSGRGQPQRGWGVMASPIDGRGSHRAVDGAPAADADAARVQRAAIDFARRGYRVFPASAASRAPWYAKGGHEVWAPDPLGAAGLRCATDDCGVVESEWPLVPGVAVGLVPPEGVVIIDADEKHREGIVGLLLGRWPRLIDGGHHVTRSQGAHFPLRLPAGVALRQSVDRERGVDVRVGGRGYVIAPPCPGYRIVRPFARVEALPELPLTLIEFLQERPRVRRTLVVQPEKAVDVLFPRRYVWAAVREEHDRVAGTAPGARNSALHRGAVKLGTLVGAGVLAHEDAHDALLVAALSPGLPHREATRTIASGIGYGLQHPRRLAGGAA